MSRPKLPCPRCQTVRMHLEGDPLAGPDPFHFEVWLACETCRATRDPIPEAERLAVEGRVLLYLGKHDQALIRLREAVDRGAGVFAKVCLGVALANTGQHAAAIEVYEGALADALPPSDRARVLTNLGGCYSALGQVGRGEALHREAITLAPDDLGPRWNLFANLHQRGRRAAALAVLDACLAEAKLDPHTRARLVALRDQL